MRQEINIPGGVLVTQDPRIRLILKDRKEVKKPPAHPVRRENKEPVKV